MQIYTLTEAKAKFSEVVERAMKGEEIVVTRQGKNAVTILACEKVAKKSSIFGLMKGEIAISPDFEAWPEDISRSLGIID